MRNDRLLFWVSAVAGLFVTMQKSGMSGEVSAPAALAAWDTAKASLEPLDSAAIAAKAGWTAVPRSAPLEAFQGDAVVTNGRILAVLRKRGSGLEVYSLDSQGATRRAQLRLAAPDGALASEASAVSLIANSRSALQLRATFRTAKGASLIATYQIKRGDISIEMAPGAGTGRLRVDCPSRFVVLPDFFADDMVVDARSVSLAQLTLPSENFLLHLTGDHDAMGLCVFENADQEVQVSLEGTGEQRMVTGSEIHFGDNKKIWFAVLASPEIWHERSIRSEDTDKTLPLDWKMPFVAQWRVDFTRPNLLNDSWEMLLKEKRGDTYVKPAWLGAGENRVGADRRRWTTVLGHFYYPCWTEADGRGYLQPLKNRALSFAGPAVLYPINRVEETPSELFTVVDVVRNSLGVGPCEYILSVESQKQALLGRATCAARDALKEIYQNKQQKQRRRDVERALDDALTFVTHIRSRITAYIEFGRQMRAFLVEQQKQHPDLKEFLADMSSIAQEFETNLERRQAKIETPEVVAQMNDEFRRTLMDYEGPDVMDRLKVYTDHLTQIGGNQDELVGECRWVARSLRQRAGLRMALDPKCADLARQIRDRTREVLLKPASYEGARH